ncbi:SMP-30/gluconolactonase/LRE family protein [Hyphomonas johnsonii]|uniref:Gluconolactonase n=1 Tax=Hyphomonas johnsonii MHS-2 TaxID=1280950 RepID=A0A059FU44_9PROT|nr:SMP-30/gluconolactonase/LRE family protein [Hyphomonas johnsonii]KCZ94112.1 gluconolactonase [Hyphomonas johnsonii MHS-2]
MQYKRHLSTVMVIAGLMVMAGCESERQAWEPTLPPASLVYAQPEGAGIVVLDTALAAEVVDEGAKVEQLTEGAFGWSEGPVWIRDGAYLLFSDVPGNAIHKWSAEAGLETFLQPSGYVGEDTDGVFREPGANGLIRGDAPGTILLADHGNRAIARLDLETKEKTLLATHFAGKRFSSPNDLVLAGDGAIYFTDPPYGLRDMDTSPFKEQTFNGVYLWRPDEGGGTISVIDDSLTRPNGVVLSPDGSTLYVSVSDPEAARVYAYTLGVDGLATDRRVFVDLTPMVQQGYKGLPDGMAVDVDGRVYVAGPGGVHVFLPDGTPVARIVTGTPVANCTFGDDGHTLYLTSAAFLARVRLKATGLGFRD